MSVEAEWAPPRVSNEFQETAKIVLEKKGEQKPPIMSRFNGKVRCAAALTETNSLTLKN